MAKIYVNLYLTAIGTIGGNWNEFDDSTTTGVLSADLIDIDGNTTGHSLTLDTAFTSEVGSGGVATAGFDDFPESFFDSGWYSGATSGQLSISATNGQKYIIEIAGHASDSARDTDYTATGGNNNPYRYNNAGTGAPAAPIMITGTVTGGAVVLTQALVSTFAYMNGFSIEFLPSGYDALESVSPNSGSDAYLAYGYEGTPAPVTGDVFVYETTDTGVTLTPGDDTEIILSEVPSTTLTYDVYVIRAATLVASTAWTVTIAPASAGSSITATGRGLIKAIKKRRGL